MAFDAYLKIFNAENYLATVKPRLSSLRKGEGLEETEQLLMKYYQSELGRKLETAEAIGATRSFYLFRQAGSLLSPEAESALFECGSVLFRLLCKQSQDDLLQISGRLLEFLSARSTSWQQFSDEVFGNSSIDHELEACLGPGSRDLGSLTPQLRSDCRLAGERKNELPEGLVRSELMQLIGWIDEIESNSGLGLALIWEW